MYPIFFRFSGSGWNNEHELRPEPEIVIGYGFGSHLPKPNLKIENRVPA